MSESQESEEKYRKSAENKLKESAKEVQKKIQKSFNKKGKDLSKGDMILRR